MEVSFVWLCADRGHEDDPYFLSLSLLLNLMPCHVVCICGTLFNAYDPPIETGLRERVSSRKGVNQYGMCHSWKLPYDLFHWDWPKVFPSSSLLRATLLWKCVSIKSSFINIYREICLEIWPITPKIRQAYHSNQNKKSFMHTLEIDKWET
jgi:hypothetical protein